MTVGGLSGRGHPGMSFGTSFTTRGGAPQQLSFRRRKIYPMVPTPFASALAHLELACPRCAKPLVALGDRYGCEPCGGVFVEPTALASMMQAMTGTPFTPPAPSGAVSAPCPACREPMTSESFEGEHVDRCSEHGTWFDAGELSDVLAEAGAPESLATRMKRWLFGDEEAR